MARTAIIGFGEAGQAFAGAGDVCAYDRLSGSDAGHRRIAARALSAGVNASCSLTDALCSADVVLSVVTADQAFSSARDAARSIERGALYFDMNSVAPATKLAAADVIEAAGARYVDAAVMAPVLPARRAVPMLLSGSHATEAATALTRLGFTGVRVLGGAIGRAATVKMIRSVVIKGIEALTDEMMAAADAAGVVDDVMTALGDDWRARAAYNRERMATHGVRRAAEMEQAVATLAALGVDQVMTRATVVRQRAAGLRAAANCAVAA